MTECPLLEVLLYTHSSVTNLVMSFYDLKVLLKRKGRGVAGGKRRLLPAVVAFEFCQ